jgi:hypothetical protein
LPGRTDSLIIQAPARRHNDPPQLLAVERPRQNIEPTPIQDVGPKRLIGDAGGDDQLCRMREEMQVVEQLLPWPRRETSLCNHQTDRITLKAHRGPAPVMRFAKPPAEAAQQLMHQQPIIVEFPYEESLDGNL